MNNPLSEEAIRQIAREEALRVLAEKEAAEKAAQPTIDEWMERHKLISDLNRNRIKRS